MTTDRQPPFPPLGFLRQRDAELREEMDSPDADPEALEATYGHFARVNTAVAGWRGVYEDHIRPLLSATKRTHALDIGSGAGDIAAALARWARADSLRLHITALDPDPRAHNYATRHPSALGVDYLQGHSAELVARGAHFDIVISNHLLHHLSAAELQNLLSDSVALSRRLAIHSDIRRHPMAYALFSAGTLPWFRGSFIRHDGLASIRRSYTAQELAQVAPPGWTVETRPPFRNLLIHRGPDA
ncbi:class I SAM-dependent methyltransferase [Arthrobacter sp. 35W]|uniref:class I SAM-dependent methyltransferase n=1 Tax=Arthrobacter sp. 35W TaxID=1132441 RepID=UPI00040283C7|nr:class I SAM-dependent methyltransferase [Arthrobacter sp. 35W]